jgi:hypothetical protein
VRGCGCGGSYICLWDSFFCVAVPVVACKQFALTFVQQPARQPRRTLDIGSRGMGRTWKTTPPVVGLCVSLHGVLRAKHLLQLAVHCHSLEVLIVLLQLHTRRGVLLVLQRGKVWAFIRSALEQGSELLDHVGGHHKPIAALEPDDRRCFKGNAPELRQQGHRCLSHTPSASCNETEFRPLPEPRCTPG